MFGNKRLKSLEREISYLRNEIGRLQRITKIKAIPLKGTFVSIDGFARVDINEVVEGLLHKLGYEVKIKEEHFKGYDIVKKRNRKEVEK